MVSTHWVGYVHNIFKLYTAPYKQTKKDRLLKKAPLEVRHNEGGSFFFLSASGFLCLLHTLGQITGQTGSKLLNARSRPLPSGSDRTPSPARCQKEGTHGWAAGALPVLWSLVFIASCRPRIKRLQKEKRTRLLKSPWTQRARPAPRCQTRGPAAAETPEALRAAVGLRSGLLKHEH